MQSGATSTGQLWGQATRLKVDRGLGKLQSGFPSQILKMELPVLRQVAVPEPLRLSG